MHQTAALTQMGFGNMLAQADGVALAVLLLLLLMAVFSWYYILTKAWRAWNIRKLADGVVAGFWEAPSLPEGVQAMEKQLPSEPFSKVALDGVNAASHHEKHTGGKLGEVMARSEFVERALRKAISRETTQLETGLTFLATVGATAPFVGLFGTVWGIYHALISISIAGQASLDKVAGPIGEALIMTAMGLAVAVPAVLGFNGLLRGNKSLMERANYFSHDVEAALLAGSRVAVK